VRDRVNRVLPLLPKTIEQPTVEKFDPDSAPVPDAGVSANKPIRDITEYADKRCGGSSRTSTASARSW
jgi:multidrug efflux pump subunit AcrB